MKYVIFIFFLFFLVQFSFAQQEDGSRGSTPISVGKAETGTKRALVIGISDYQEKELKLNFADNDAYLFKDYLTKIEKVSEDNISFLANEKATFAQIILELKNLLNIVNPDDLVYIYFAGHGDVVDDFGEKEGFLLAADANASQEYYSGGSISLSFLNDKVVPKIIDKGAKVVMILDACKSGFKYKDSSIKNMRTVQAIFENSTNFLSCGPDELSYESDDINHGYFTYYLVKGLLGNADKNADNKLQYNEIDDYLYENVNNTVSKKYKQNQTPIIRTENARAVYKSVNSEDKNITFSINLKEKIKSENFKREILSVNKTESEEVKHISSQFAEALKRKDLYGKPSSAFELYKGASANTEIPKEFISKMKHKLINHFTSDAQILINKYIGNQEILPSGTEFKKQAEYLELCLAILDKEDFMYDRILTSKLFLESYSIIRHKNYSNYKIAKQKLLEALNIEPRAAYIHNALGIVYKHEQNNEQSLHHYNKAKELIPTWSFPVNNIGTVYHDTYQYQKAKQYYLEASQMKGIQSSANQNIGMVSEIEGKYTLAEIYFKKSLEFDDKNIKAIQLLGDLYYSRGNIRKAKEYYKKAIAIDSVNFLKEYGLDNYINDFEISQEIAEKLYIKAIQEEPFYASVYANYADFLRAKFSQSKEKAQQADQLYRQAIENDPFYTWSYAGRGWLLFNQKKNEEALQSFKKGIEVNSDKESSYYYLAKFYQNALKDNKNAIENYLKALEINPYYRFASSSLIELYKNLNENEKAVLLIKDIIEKNPENPNNWNNKGDYYFAVEEYQTAIQAYLKAIELDKDNANGYTNISYCYLMLNEPQKAIEFYQKAIESNPIKNRKEILNTKIIALYREQNKIGEIHKAKTLVETAYQLNRNEETLFLLSEFYYLNGFNKEAEKLLQEIPSNSEASKSWMVKLYEIGLKISLENNNKKETERYYNSLINSNEKPNPVVEVLYLYRTEGLSKAKEKKASVNQLYFQENYLRTRFSQKTIKILENLN